MRVLFLSETFYPHGSGAEFATYLYADLLSKEGIEVTVLTNQMRGEPGFSKKGSFRVYRLPLFESLGTAKYSAFKRLDIMFSGFFNELLKWADVVYVPRFWFAAIVWAKAHGKPVIVHMHDYISVCSLSNLFNATASKVCSSGKTLCSPKCIYFFEKAHGRDFGGALASILLNSTVGRYLPKFSMLADAVVCVSTKHKDLIVDRAPLFRGKTHVIYNPFPAYDSLEIGGDDFGYFGGPDVLKGFNVLRSAASRINLACAGSMRIHCTRFGALSEKFAGELGRVGFSLYKRLETHELEQLYRKLRSVLVPSIWNEPWPYVVVEALLRGRFVVASRIGGIPEQLEGCKGSILCEPEDSRMLAESMEYVRGLSRDEVVDLGCQNKASFLGRFDNDSSVRKFISLCESLV